MGSEGARRQRWGIIAAAGALSAEVGCAQLIGAGFDGAQLAPDDAGLTSGGDDSAAAVDSPMPPPKDGGGDALVAPVDAGGADTGPIMDAAPSGPCEGGLGYLTALNACVSFAGYYQTQDPACHGVGSGTCRHENPLTMACSCPQGSTATGTMSGIANCNDGVNRLAPIFACQANGSSPVDWGGAFQLQCSNSACSGTTTCLVPNTYTSACSCPAGTAPITFTEVLDTMGTIGQMTFCLNQAVPAVTFAGAYQNNNGSTCVVPNPETGSCNCPAGAGTYTVRLLDFFGGSTPKPAPIFACIQGY
jgi:hypothetical protein